VAWGSGQVLASRDGRRCEVWSEGVPNYFKLVQLPCACRIAGPAGIEPSRSTEVLREALTGALTCRVYTSGSSRIMRQSTSSFLVGFLFMLAALVGIANSAGPIAAQVPLMVDPGSSERSREDLEALLQYYEDALLSPAYSEEVKASLSVDAARVRARLRDGDFKLGDRIVLSVQGEPNIPDTLAIEAGPKVTLELFGEIPLAGVLRSEVEDRIREALSAFLRDPVVTAQGLMRVSVQGAVGAPGFYVVPGDMLLSEAIMVAGGPTQNSALDDLRIERGVETLMEGADIQEALRAGLSLDQLNMQAGDQVLLPAETPGGIWTRIGVIAGLATTITFLIVNVSR